MLHGGRLRLSTTVDQQLLCSMIWCYALEAVRQARVQCLLLDDRKLARRKAVRVLWDSARPRDLFLTAEMVAVNTFRGLAVTAQAMWQCQIKPITWSDSGFWNP